MQAQQNKISPIIFGVNFAGFIIRKTIIATDDVAVYRGQYRRAETIKILQSFAVIAKAAIFMGDDKIQCVLPRWSVGMLSVDALVYRPGAKYR